MGPSGFSYDYISFSEGSHGEKQGLVILDLGPGVIDTQCIIPVVSYLGYRYYLYLKHDTLGMILWHMIVLSTNAQYLDV